MKVLMIDLLMDSINLLKRYGLLIQHTLFIDLVKVFEII